MSKSGLPFGAEFSPQQIDLSTLLRIAKETEGQIDELERKIKELYFANRSISDANKSKLAMNTRIALQSYKLLTEDGYLTEMGKELYEYSEQKLQDKLHERFAQHILTNLGGHFLIEAIRHLNIRGEKITREKIAHYLQEYHQIHVPNNGRHISTMKLWLEKAGILTKHYGINEDRLKEILGIGYETLSVSYGLTEQQRDFLRALATMPPPPPYSSVDVAKKAIDLYGTKFDMAFIPKEVLYPLQEKGLITLQRGTKEKGRGSKPFKVFPTEKFKKEILGPILDDLVGKLDPTLKNLTQRPLKEILDDLESADKNKKGVALEALALNIMSQLGLKFLGTRVRAVDTGGAEVDLLFESPRLVYSRWQVQCKNTRKVGIEDIVREVGLQPLLKSNVIVFITTGSFAKQAKKFAEKIMRHTNLVIVLIEGKDIKAIAKNPSQIFKVMHKNSEWARSLKGAFQE